MLGSSIRLVQVSDIACKSSIVLDNSFHRGTDFRQHHINRGQEYSHKCNSLGKWARFSPHAPSKAGRACCIRPGFLTSFWWLFVDATGVCVDATGVERHVHPHRSTSPTEQSAVACPWDLNPVMQMFITQGRFAVVLEFRVPRRFLKGVSKDDTSARRAGSRFYSS